MGAFKIFNETTQQWEYATVVQETNSSLVIGADLIGTVNGTNATFNSPTEFWNIAVYKNGVRMREGATNDYMITGTSVIFNTAPATGSILTADITTRAEQMINGSNNLHNNESVTGLIDGVNDTYSVSAGSYIGGSLSIYRNGLKLARTHYVETSASTGVFEIVDPPKTGDIITVDYHYATGATGNAVSLDGFSVQGIFDSMYPIGSLYMNDSVATNPATLLNMPWSTWVAITDKMIMAKGSTYTTDGGSATHTHDIPLQEGYDSNKAFPYSGSTFEALVNEMGGVIYSKSIVSRSRAPHGTALSTANIETWRMRTAAVSNLPPYTTAYMWRRTA